ncbi:hypothetical protein [Marinobacter alkaliphilus]|uniref:Uncharacterized protein n=1 Tax=Marinobacter alkaliphilus TaxID=254719 RepID=A0ABZ3E8W4_9GAMM
MAKRPIEPADFVHGPKVVDIGDIRVARGKTRVPCETCRHRQLVYDPTERRVYCEDCQQDVDGFDAFLNLVHQHESAWGAIRKARTEILEAQSHNLISRAAKALDQYWRSRKTVPNCPHCNEALLPEDVAGGRLRTSSAELARRRRKNSDGL